MQERTNPESDVATMVMLLDIGVSLRDIAERFKLEVKTVERLIVEHQRRGTAFTHAEPTITNQNAELGLDATPKHAQRHTVPSFSRLIDWWD
jgi:transposase